MCKDAKQRISIGAERMEALSESRRSSLEAFATATGSELAIVFLYEKRNEGDYLLAGYTIGRESVRQQLREKKYKIDAVDVTKPYQSSFAKFMEEITSELGLENLARLQPLFQKPVTGKRKLEFIGVVVYVAPEKNSKFARAAATILSSEFSLSRSQRVVETTIAAQDILQSVEEPIENPLMSVAEEISTAVFCKNIYIKYANQASFVDVRTGKQIRLNIVESNIETHGYAVRCSLQQNGVKEYCPAIFVPVDKPHFQLRKTSFSPISSFLKHLNRELYSMEAIVFSEKIGQHYLQKEFSTTDIDICNRIFYNMQGFVASNEFQGSLIKVIEELERVDESEDYDATETQKFILELDKTITAVTAVTIFRNSTNFSLQVENDAFIDPSYLEKISSKYLSKVFSTNGGEIAEGVFVGVDKIEGKTTLEVHLSSHLKDGKLYFLELSSEWLSDATLRALLHYFSELHVRLRREKFLEERESFMSQVRHVVVHHVSTAHKSVSSVQRAWNNAGRDKNLWEELRKDKRFKSFVDLALLNLSMATRKLELGRFIIDEISPSNLNRKQVDVVSLIQEILETFKFNKDEKRLVFRAVLKGSPPNVLNADKELLSIALVNLIDNAVKYSSVDKEVVWGIEYKLDKYRFHITSRGVPIQLDGEKEEMLRTRLRAKQLDHLNQRHGTGWGLPVAAKILEAHHREALLDFESIEDPQERSNSENTFFFDMPYKTGQSQAETDRDAK